MVADQSKGADLIAFLHEAVPTIEALIAIAHKPASTANATLKSGSPWQAKAIFQTRGLACHAVPYQKIEDYPLVSFLPNVSHVRTAFLDADH